MAGNGGNSPMDMDIERDWTEWEKAHEQIQQPCLAMTIERLQAIHLLSQPTEIQTIALLKSDIRLLLDAFEKREIRKTLQRENPMQLSLFSL